MNAQKRREITTLELADVLGVAHKSILTTLSQRGDFRGLTPSRKIKPGGEARPGLRWKASDVRDLLGAPLTRLEAIVDEPIAKQKGRR